MANQGQTGVAQRIDTGGDGHDADTVEGINQALGAPLGTEAVSEQVTQLAEQQIAEQF